VGDSWTFGLNVPADQSYPFLLEKFLRKKEPGIKIEVINAGIPGKSLEDMRVFLEKNIEVLDPDGLIFLGGINGILKEDMQVENRSGLSVMALKINSVLAETYLFNLLDHYVGMIRAFVVDLLPQARRQAAEEFVEVRRMAGLIDQWRAQGRFVFILNYPLPTERSGFYYVTQENDLHAKRPVLMLLSEIRGRIGFVDLYGFFKALPSRDDLFLSMFFTHPNEKGYAVMAELIGMRLLREVPAMITSRM
jgi:lysophospholipase L1-like esterase